MSVIMVAAAIYGVLQLAVIGSPMRSLRLSTVVLTVAVGVYGSGVVAALIELGYAHAVASSATQPLVEAMGRGSYTVVPVVEELAKLAPLLLAGLNIKIRYQLGLTDYVILGAATGAGLGLYEVLLSHLLDAQHATPYPYGGWMLPGGLSLSSTYIPDWHTVLSTWLPASLGSLDLSFTQPSLDTNLHLAWGAIGALGTGLLLRGRGWRRLFGLLPIAYAMGHHTLVNYTGSRDAQPPGWTASLLGTANDLVTYAPLVCLATAMALDFAQLQRSKQAMPAVLLNAERTGNAAIGPLTAFSARCPPWTALVALRFARMRRSLLYAAGRTEPGRLELLHAAVAGTAARIDAVSQDIAWDTGRIRAYLKEVRHSNPWRRRWPLLAVPVILMLPSLLFLGLGSFTSTKGLQKHFTTGAGQTLLMWFGIAALIWALIQLALLLRAWRAASRQPLAEPQAALRLRVFTATGCILTTGLLLAAHYRGTPLGGNVTDSRAMLLAGLENLELYAGIALTMLALAALIMLFPPGGLALAGGGILAGAASVDAVQVAALGGAGIALMAQGAQSGTDGEPSTADSSGSQQPSTEPDAIGGQRTASGIREWAREQGWTETQTENGPPKFTDENGVVRVTLKQGSGRAPGSADPHVEIRNANGERIDPEGNPVTRKSVGNHTAITWDLP
ncbi:hypothetical protein [Streptomyces sp. NBC_01089]|uniref:hypothetical protein n=1 Tax=Streptomyces sp. NBC_01089 TaxID=2903747 RepID=UPI003865FF12|nr:hypothetical protein OG510_17490 [Streptomyces sp. NBC_01089]